MIVAGVDPGFSGGIATIKDGKILDMHIMPIVSVKQKKNRPAKKREDGSKQNKTETYVANVREYNFVAIRDIFKDIYAKGVTCVYVERVHGRPGEGVSSVFNFGVGYGMLLATLTCVGLPYVVVTPNAWTKHMLGGIPKTIDTKDRTKLAASRLFNLDLFVPDRCRTPHAGLVDATMIAMYGYKKETGVV